MVAFLLMGVIGANVLKRFLPRIPEVFILIIIGIILSYVPAISGFELEPEFFMLLIIAPLMFIDGQKQSFNKIVRQFQGIFLLSVGLAFITVIIVGVITDWIEAKWTLPLAIALAAIVTPTDAVAVKSLTGSRDIPKGVGEALELESLFNDATGLVLLDLALSVLAKNTFSIVDGVIHFLFVAVGGILVGFIVGFLLVMLRHKLNVRGENPEITTIPISLLTPFIVYLIAENMGMSGILAVVATGIEHNWESSKLRLTSTNVQLTTSTIWNVLTDVLNDFVFLILGMSLPAIYEYMVNLHWLGTLSLFGIAILIYLVMLGLRFFWALHENNTNIVAFFGEKSDKNHYFYSKIFAVSGVHGTVTLAMALSLPHTINGINFPYRKEIIIISMFVILISMVVGAIVLTLKLPEKTEMYGMADLGHVRNKMVDYAILQVRASITDHSVRDDLTNQLQSQKDNRESIDRQTFSNNYYLLFSETKELVDSFIHSNEISEKYDDNTVNIYNNMSYRLLNDHKRGKSIKHVLKHYAMEIVWHSAHGIITKKQQIAFRDSRIKSDPKYSARVNEWKNTREELLALNEDVINVVDQYLDDVLRARLAQHHSDNDYIYMVQKSMNRCFDNIRHEYKRVNSNIDSALYVQAFQYEYDFIQSGVKEGYITRPIASALYTEINQAQLLQLQQLQIE